MFGSFAVGGLLLFLVLVPVASSTSVSSCSGNSYKWTGNGDNSTWNDANNWTPNGVPGKRDTATIDAPAGQGYYAHGAQSVCDLSISADAGANAVVLLDTGPSGITVSGDFSASGSGVQFQGSMTVDGTTTISGGNQTDGAVYYASEVSLPATTTLQTENLVIQNGTDFELADGSTIVKVNGTAMVGSSSIWSDGGNPPGDDIAKLQLDGSTVLAGNVEASLDWNLGPAASLDLAGNLLDVHGGSNSRWQGGADLESSTSGGVAQFNGDGIVQLLVDGKITIGSGATLRITGPSSGATLSDGTSFNKSGGPVGGPGEIQGAGRLDWVRGYEQGSITLDPGFHTYLDGGGTRSMGGSAFYDMGPSVIVNRGDLAIRDGDLHTDFSAGNGQLLNEGTLTVSAGASIAGWTGQVGVVNEQGGTLAVSAGSSGSGTATVTTSVVNDGQVQAASGNRLLLQGGTANLLDNGSLLSGGGTVQVGASATLQLLGTTTLTDATKLRLDGDSNTELHAGQIVNGIPQAAVLDAHHAQGGGEFEWDAGGVYGDLLTDHDLSTLIQNTSAASHHVIDDQDSHQSLITFGSPTTLNDATISFGKDNGDELTLDAPLKMSGAAPQIGTGYTANPAAVLLINSSGSITASGSGTVATIDYPLRNLGTIDLDAAKLAAKQDYGQTGSTAITRLQAGATLTAGDGTGTVTLDGGKLTGVGTLAGNLAVTGGTVAPGSQVGELKVTGNYFQGSAGTLRIAVDGTGAGHYSVLGVVGSATLGGTLALIPSSHYAAAAAAGNRIGFLRYTGARKRTFATTIVNPPLEKRESLTPDYGTAHVVQAVVGPPGSTRSGGGVVLVRVPAQLDRVAANGRMIVRITCGAGRRCRGTAALVATVRPRHRKRSVHLGSARFSVAAGHTGKIRIRLNAAGRRLLHAHHRRLQVKLEATYRSGPRSRTRSRRITLKAAPRHRG